MSKFNWSRYYWNEYYWNECKQWLLIFAVMFVACFCAIKVAHASPEWTTENVYKAITAESIGEGTKGMEYVASALYNRRTYGLDIGCCGLNRPGLRTWMNKQPVELLEYAHQLADRVMHDENNFDIVRGATHFESTDFPTPSWARSGKYVEVMRYKKHVFYRRKE